MCIYRTSAEREKEKQYNDSRENLTKLDTETRVRKRRTLRARERNRERARARESKKETFISHTALHSRSSGLGPKETYWASGEDSTLLSDVFGSIMSKQHMVLNL